MFKYDENKWLKLIDRLSKQYPKFNFKDSKPEKAWLSRKLNWSTDIKVCNNKILHSFKSINVLLKAKNIHIYFDDMYEKYFIDVR